MKKLIYFIIPAILLSAENATAIDYKVTGTLDIPDGMKVIMTDFTRDGVMIDSAFVKNGKFEMSGEYERNALVRIETADYRQFGSGILDSNLIIDFQTHNPLDSTELNRKFNEFSNKLNDYEEELSTFLKELDSHGFQGQERGEIYKQLYDKRLNSIVKLIQSIVAEDESGLAEKAITTTSRFLSLSPEQWDTIYSSASDRLKDLPWTKSTNQRYENIKNTREGMMFVDFEGKTVDGESVKFSDYIGKGKYVLVDFWASWCGPCREEAKSVLLPLSERIADSDKFEILGVATWDKPKNTKKYLESNPYPWNQIIDTEQVPMEKYGFNYVPMIILFGPDGTILHRDLRGDRIFQVTDRYGLLK